MKSASYLAVSLVWALARSTFIAPMETTGEFCHSSGNFLEAIKSKFKGKLIDLL
jgi:hypothetical protein